MAPGGRRTGHSGRMRPALICRTIVIAGWLLALLATHPGPIAAAGPAIALAGIWAVSLIRDGGAGRGRPGTTSTPRGEAIGG